MQPKLRGLAWLASASTLAFSSAAMAQTDVDDVVITGSRAANASISGLTGDPMRLPLSVRVLDQALITQTGAANLSDLFDYAGGMSRQNGFGGAWDAYAIRGFSGDINQGPDLLVNRFAANRGFNARRDTATVETFQVLKGPASALSGKGEPGGSINIVTKAPQSTPHAGFEIGYGSFGTVRGVADIGGGFAPDAAGRLIAVYQQSDGWRDHVGSDRLLLAPSLSWRPNAALRLLYQAEFNDVSIVHDRGIVAVGGNAKALPRTRFFGEPNDGRTNQRTLQQQGSLTWVISPQVAVEAGVQYRDGSFRGQSTQNSALVGTQLRRQLRVHDYRWDDLSARAEVSFNGRAAGVDHQLRVGGDAFAFDQDRVMWRFNPTAANPYSVDINNPVYGQAKPVPPLNQDLGEKLSGRSLYIQDLVSLGPQVTVLAGLRQDWIDQTNTNRRNGVVTKQSPSQASPRLAVTWAPVDSLSAYVSWGRSFRYNQGADARGGAFAPERGEAREAGIKWRVGRRLTGTASLFRIDKENILVNDPANAGFSISAGEARSKGLEADVNLRLGEAFTVTAVYSHIETAITRDTRAALVGSALSNIPRNSGGLYANWRSAPQGKGAVSLGGGVVYVGGRAGDDVNSGFRLPGYTTVRANLAYGLTDRTTLQIDVENLFDAYFIESSYSDVWVAPGAPRSVTARLKFAF